MMYLREGIKKLSTEEHSKFQKFSYMYPNLHYSQSTVLLGGCIHTVKSFFGLGVNAGLESVVAFKMYHYTMSLGYSNK